MFGIVGSLLVMLTIGMVLAIVFILTGVFTKKYWLEVVGRMCFYVPVLIMAIVGELLMFASLYYPLFFGTFSGLPGDIWFPMIVFGVAFLLILYEISTLFEPKDVRNKKLIEHLKLRVKSQEKKLEDDKKELETLIKNQTRIIEKDKAEIENLEKNL